MTISTTTPYKILPGQTILKRVSDGHYYGEVASVERMTDRPHVWQDTYEVTFTDGDTKVFLPGDTVIVKD